MIRPPSFFLLIVVLIVSLVSYANSTNIIQSKEDIVFHTPDMIKFSGVGKISEFKGIIDRTYFTASDLRMVDLYQFNTDEVKVSNKFCALLIDKIFGIRKSKIYKLKTLRVESSNKGSICEAHIADKNEVKEDPYIRYLTIGFVNAKAHVLVYHPKSIDDFKITEIKKFWNSLR